jgi:hypothetical protein
MQKVTVHHFRKWDINSGQYLTPPLKSTAERIEEAGGEIILETAEEIDVSKLDDEGRYDPSKG